MKRAPRSLQHHVLYRKYNGQDSEISALLGKCGIMAAFSHYEISGQLGRAICRTQAKQALEAARTNVINQRLIECMTYLIDHIEANPGCATDTDFKRLSADYIRWN